MMVSSPGATRNNFILHNYTPSSDLGEGVTWGRLRRRLGKAVQPSDESFIRNFQSKSYPEARPLSICRIFARVSQLTGFSIQVLKQGGKNRFSNDTMWFAESLF